MPVARHSSSWVPASVLRSWLTIAVKSPVGLTDSPCAVCGVESVSAAGAWGCGWSVPGCESWGSPWGSSRFGIDTCGRVVLATDTIVSAEGPALAGAMIVAVSVAQMSNAERKESNVIPLNLRLTTKPKHVITCEYYRPCL